ncbi:MAG: S46 family peptidase, partial [Longimicrobiales bacterium]|nr:S46 family peptidase [Longimicrobiales bacterium]
VRAGRFDQGKMWTFDVPPVEYFRQTYGVPADEAWFTRARLGALRIPGCSASFVSPRGLVLTNHHCAREFVTQVQARNDSVLQVVQEKRNFLDDGFYARSVSEERAVNDFEADQLIAIRDVSARVDDAVDGRTGEERRERIEKVTSDIEEDLLEEFGGEEAGVVVEVVALYNGARHSAYVFRRYQNARLVMAPELQIGFFGGDPDNFTYPRYNLDFALLRIYDDQGRPLDTSEWYFPWSTEGVEAGDPIFIVGNPGSTSRLQTVAQLEFRRDVQDRATLAFLERRAEAMKEFIDTWPERAEPYDLRNDWFGAMNAVKSFTGQIEGLHDPVILAKRADTDRQFLATLAADSVLGEKYGGLIEEMAELQQAKRELAPGYGAFLGLTADGFASPTLHRALLAFQVLNARQQGAPDGAVAGLIAAMDSVEAVPPELDEWLIEARIQEFVEAYGADERWVGAILRGRTPEGVAASIRANSVLADSAASADRIRRGLVPAEDPALRFVGLYVPAFVRFQQAVGQLSQREEEVAAAIGRARYEIHGTALPPDATFSLRIADGVVEGYPYNGTEAPPHTTFFGMYDRYHAFKAAYPEDSPWDLPERWRTPPAGLDLATPVNFVSTADIIGGNSGSPVLNADLEVVGVVFDGNIESLPGDYIYLPERNRSVTVDARGILAALRHVYGMDAIVEELLQGSAAAVR